MGCVLSAFLLLAGRSILSMMEACNKTLEANQVMNTTKSSTSLLARLIIMLLIQAMLPDGTSLVDYKVVALTRSFFLLHDGAYLCEVSHRLGLVLGLGSPKK